MQEQLAARERGWVLDVKDARSVLEEAQAGTPELVDVAALHELAHRLREQWKQARKFKHVMAWSLLEVSVRGCRLHAWVECR